MSSPGDLNGVPVSAPEAPQDGLRERGSFIVFGRALGPSPFTDPGFAHHANSEFVDLSREYEYPLQYRNLKGLGLISAVGFGCLYIAGDANMLKQPETVLLVVVGFLALLFAGCFFCCVNCLHFLCAPASPPQLLSRTELRHLLGTTACTFWTILLLVAGGLKHFITAQPGERWLEEALFIIESFGAIVVLVPSWYLVNRFSKEPVKAGLIMSMFWAGAIFSAECAGIFNTLLLLIWTAADPDCNATMPVGPKWPMEAPSGGCVAKANLEWVLTPGIVEESFKFMVLLRLVTSLEEAMKSKALTRFPRMSTISCMPCCGWFLKFAASPAVVVLCGMAAGAGFGSLENVQYIAKLSGVVKATGSILPASVRIFTAMLHIAMTGTCSFFLAISLFSQRKRPFVKFIGWIMMVIGHGSYDAFCTFQAEMPVDECFTRVECYDDKQREVCVFSRTGKLAECSCKDGVDEETRKCASNSTAVLVESEGSKNQRTAGMGSEPARTLFPPASRTADPLALRAMQLGDLCYYHDSQNRQQQCCIWSVRLDGMCQIGSSRFDRPSTDHWIPTSRLVRLDSSPVGPVGAVEPLTKANVRAHTVASAGAPTVVSAATVINGDQRSRSPKSRAPFRERRCRVKVTVNDTVEEALKRAEFYGTVKSHFQEEGSLYVRFLHTNSAQKAVSTWKGAQWA